MQNTGSQPTPRFFRIAQTIGIIGVSLLLINFFYQIWHLHNINAKKHATNFCDFAHGDCIKQVGDATVTLTMSPLPLNEAKTADLTVILNRMQADQVGVLLLPYPSGDKSAQPILLKMTEAHTYSHKIIFPKTNTAPQHWVAMVMLKQGNKQITVPFEFDVKN